MKASNIIKNQLIGFPRRLMSERRKPRNPQKEAMVNMAKLTPHIALGGIFLFTGKN